MRTKRTHRRGFTLVELMVVAVIIAILTALLLPVIAGAVRTARNATVTAEFNLLATSMQVFKNQYGEFPPSRIMLSENGYWNTADTTMIAAAPGGADITYGELAQRSITALRKFWPDLPTSTTGPLFIPRSAVTFYDFNGNGTLDAAPGPPPRLTPVPGRGYILDGAECLAFFLGGVPLNTGTTGDPNLSLSGFARGKIPYGNFPGTNNPISPRPLPNPFRNNLDNANIAYGVDREKSFYEFRAERLRDLDGDGFPEYIDSLGTEKPIAYFRADNGYDPNDVNYPEPNESGSVAAMVRRFRVAFVVSGGREAISPGPNPYTTSLANTGTTVAWHKPQSFQLISAGGDGLYGLGGQYVQEKAERLNPELKLGTVENTNDPLADEPNAPYEIREVERDNLTNFANGMLD